MKLLFFLNFLLFHKLLVFTSFAQSELSYGQLNELMLKGNSTLRYAELSSEIALNELSISKNSRLPDLNGNIYGSVNDGRALDPITYQYSRTNFFNNTYRLQSNLTLFQGGKVNSVINKSKIDLAVQNLNLKNTSIILSKELLEAFVEANLNKELINTWEKKLSDLLSLKKITESKVKMGRGTSASMALIDIEVNTLNQYLQNLNFRHDAAIYKIKRLIGLDQQKKLKLKYLESFNIDSAFYSENTIEGIAKKSLLFDIAQKKALSAQKDIQFAATAKYPSLTLGWTVASGYSSLLNNSFQLNNNWESQINNNYYQTVSMNLYLPIFNKFSFNKIIQKSKLIHLQTKEKGNEEFEKLLEYLNINAVQMANQYNIYKTGLNSLSGFSQVNEEIVQKYSAGRIDTYEYLIIQQQKFLLIESLITAKYSYLLAQKNIELIEKQQVSLNE